MPPGQRHFGAGGRILSNQAAPLCVAKQALERYHHLHNHDARARFQERVFEAFDRWPRQLRKLRAADKRQDVEVEVHFVISQRAIFQPVESASIQPKLARLLDRDAH